MKAICHFVEDGFLHCCTRNTLRHLLNRMKQTNSGEWWKVLYPLFLPRWQTTTIQINMIYFECLSHKENINCTSLYEHRLNVVRLLAQHCVIAWICLRFISLIWTKYFHSLLEDVFFIFFDEYYLVLYFLLRTHHRVAFKGDIRTQAHCLWRPADELLILQANCVRVLSIEWFCYLSSSKGCVL